MNDVPQFSWIFWISRKKTKDEDQRNKGEERQRERERERERGPTDCNQAAALLFNLFDRASSTPFYLATYQGSPVPS